MSFADNFILAFQFYVQDDRFTQTYAVSAIKTRLTDGEHTHIYKYV